MLTVTPKSESTGNDLKLLRKQLSYFNRAVNKRALSYLRLSSPLVLLEVLPKRTQFFFNIIRNYECCSQSDYSIALVQCLPQIISFSQTAPADQLVSQLSAWVLSALSPAQLEHAHHGNAKPPLMHSPS